MSLILGPHEDKDSIEVTGHQFRPSESGLAQLGRAVTSSLQGAATTGLRTVTEQLLGLRFDPAPEYLFTVELQGILVALFTECSGLTVSREVEDYAEGGINNYVHKLPGRVSYDNIVLKRGLSLSRALWDWFQVGLYDMNVQRINFSIIQGGPGYNLMTMVAGASGLSAAGSGWEGAGSQMMGRGFGKVKHWNVIDAYPVRWEGSDLNVSSESVSIEEIEIAHHGLDLSLEVGTPLNPGASLTGGLATGLSSSEEPTMPEGVEAYTDEPALEEDNTDNG
jgi:phage tail-like protein